MKFKKYYLIILFLFSITKADAQYGMIDMTFGQPALTVVDSSRFIGAVNSLVLQSDQKIIVGGLFTTYNTITNKNRIIRLDENGNIDPSFQPATGFANGEVQSLAIQTDGKIIAGGTFTTFNSQPRSGLVRINDADGSLDGTFAIGSGLNTGSDVYTICIQPDGKILAGGGFTTFNGLTASKILRLNSDGSIDTTFHSGTGFNGDVKSICYDTSLHKIYVAGNFGSYDGNTNANGIVRLELDGTLDTSFNMGTGFNSIVNKLLIDASGNIVAGGNFTTYQGATHKRICRLTPAGSIDNSFVAGDGFNFSVLDMQMDANGNIICSGQFSLYNTQPVGKLCRINTDGSLDLTFYTSPESAYSYSSGDIMTLAVQSNGSIIFGGGFTEYNNNLRNRIARVQQDGWLDNSFCVIWGVSRNPYYYDVAVRDIEIQPDNKLLIAIDGFEARYNGVSAPGIIRLFPDGQIDTSFHTGIGFRANSTHNSYIDCITLDTIRQKIYVGGHGAGFTSYNGTSRKNLVRLNWDGSVDSSFNVGAGFNASVNEIVLQPDGKIIVGGLFASYDGSTYNKIIRLDTIGTPDLTFIAPSATNGFNGFIRGVTSIVYVPNGNGDILVGGDFTTYNGVACNNLVKLHSDGTIDNTFNADSLTGIYDIKIQADNKIVIGGATGKGIARLEPNGTFDTSFMNNVDSGTDFDNVYEVEVQKDGKILGIGNFTEFNGNSAAGLFRLNSDGTLDNSFNAGYGLDLGYTLEIQNDEKLLIGGVITSYDSVHINGLARIDGGPLTSVNYTEASESLSVYPNPTTGEIHFELGEVSNSIVAEVYSIDGRLMQNAKFIDSRSISFNINSAPGIYFVKLIGMKKTVSIKVIKE